MASWEIVNLDPALKRAAAQLATAILQTAKMALVLPETATAWATALMQPVKMDTPLLPSAKQEAKLLIKLFH